MAKKTDLPAMEELAMDDLDAVNGGWSVGVYGSVSGINPIGNVPTADGQGGAPGGPASTGGYTVGIGIQSSFPYVTGGIYETSGTGVSSGASVGVSAGGFYSNTNADGVFTGHSDSYGLAVDAAGKVGVETSGNDTGFTVGVGVGVGAGLAGVQASGFDTNTTSMTGGAVDHSSPTIDQPTYDAMGSVTGSESVANPNYDGGHTDGSADHSTDGTQAAGADHSTDGTQATGGATDGVDHSTDGVDHSTDGTQAVGADHSNDGAGAATVDHSGDNVDHSGDQQGGFDNNNGEGGGGGGSDFA